MIKKATVGVIGAVALMGVLSVYSAYGTMDEMQVHVTKTERVADGETSKWIVMTDKMSFENTDSLLHLKFNSTDLQGKLEEGKVYTVGYYGYRIPFLSMYPNIINVTE